MAGCRVHVHLNDKCPNIFNQLKENCDNELEKFSSQLKSVVNITYSNLDFEDLYPKITSKLQNAETNPSLFLVDPFGTFAIKRFLDAVLSLEYNDFLIFMPTSQIKRFYQFDEFREKLDFPEISFVNTETYQVHQTVVEQLAFHYQAQHSNFNLIPFTIQKNSNYYGIIFGAKHLRAFDKFLDIAWKLDPKDGNANYSISVDRLRSKPLQEDLFIRKPTKKELFREQLSHKILEKEITNNFQAYEFCIRQGHPVTQAHDILVELKKAKKIHFDGRSPKIRFQYYKNRQSPNFKKVDFIVL